MASRLRKKYIGDKTFYRMALAVAVPTVIQNGITQFAALLDISWSAASVLQTS